MIFNVRYTTFFILSCKASTIMPVSCPSCAKVFDVFYLRHLLNLYRTKIKSPE